MHIYNTTDYYIIIRLYIIRSLKTPYIFNKWNRRQTTLFKPLPRVRFTASRKTHTGVVFAIILKFILKLIRWIHRIYRCIYTFDIDDIEGSISSVLNVCDSTVHSKTLLVSWIFGWVINHLIIAPREGSSSCAGLTTKRTLQMETARVKKATSQNWFEDRRNRSIKRNVHRVPNPVRPPSSSASIGTLRGGCGESSKDNNSAISSA